MRNRKKKEETHNDTHRWVISYADFITLLFAFFVVMYAISSVNVSKYRSLTDGMNSAFNKKDNHRSKISTQSQNDGPMDKKASGGDHDAFDQMNAALTQLEDSNYKVNKKEGTIELDMKAGSLFETGSADLKPIAIIKLMQVAKIIGSSNYPVVIEGYTDNQPIYTPQYPSNWELSACRAASVARVLNIFGVDSSRLSVTGYGDQNPIADNSTEEGRAENRRVNMVIYKDLRNPKMLYPGVINDLQPEPAKEEPFSFLNTRIKTQ